MTNSRTSLKRILWIGGGTDAGKSTTAQILAERHGASVYHFDRSSGAMEKLGKEKAPRMAEWIEMSMDERWQLRSPEEIAQHTFETFEEVFPVKLDEILAMTSESVVIAEGFAFVPKLVKPLIADVNQAIWMVPTETFKSTSFKRRGKDRYKHRDGCSEPELATHNFFTRDLLMAQQIREEVEEENLKLFEIDGSQTVDEVASIIEGHFAKYLNQCVGGC